MTDLHKKRTTRLSGVVVSDKMDKTIVVRDEHSQKHKKYRKIYLTSKKYKVDDPKNIYSVGDKVEFIPCRPLSKEKKWRVIYSKIKA